MWLALPLALAVALPTALAASSSELSALSALYASTNGSAWVSSANWNSGDPCVSPFWAGVACNGGGSVM
jgi:hypothetical protein